MNVSPLPMGADRPVLADGGPYLSAQGAAWEDASLPPLLRRAMRRRHDKVDEVADSVRAELERLADGLGARLRDYIEGRAGSSDAAEIQAAVQATELGDILDILRPGMDAAHQGWVEGLDEVAKLAAASVGDGGLSASDRTLNVEAVDAALRGRYADMGSVWDSRVTRPLADKMLQGLHNMVLAESLEAATDRLAASARISVDAAYVEVVTQTAMFDRFAAEQVTVAADPDGEAEWAYVGPDDGVTRPWCEHMVGKAFTRAELAPADNHQTVEHPIWSGGGYRCRHAWVPMLPKLRARYGIANGTPADVRAANAAALLSRGGRR